MFFLVVQIIMPNSPKCWTQKRDFAHQVGLFEKPNGHVSIGYKNIPMNLDDAPKVER